MTPDGIGALLGAFIGALMTTIAGGILVIPKILKAVGISAENTKQLAHHTTRIEELSKTVEVVSRANDALRKEVDDLTLDKNSLVKESDRKHAEIKDLRLQLDKADERQRMSEKTIARMEGQLSEQRTNYEAMIDRQQRRLEEYIAKNEKEKLRSAALETENAGLKTKVETLESELLATSTELSKNRDEIALLKVQLTEEQKERMSLQTAVARLETQVSQLMLTIALPKVTEVGAVKPPEGIS